MKQLLTKINFPRLVLLAALFSVLAGCGGYVAPSTLRPLTFMAGYKPQANLPFVGAYVAKEKGFFAANGLDVTIEHSTQGEHLQLLAVGKVQVTTQDAAVLLQRRADPGLPLVAISLVGQRGQQAYVALADSGIKTPKDWEGKKVGYKGTPPPDIFALLNAAGVDAQKVELVNVGFDPRVLLEGQVDVYPVFKSNEPNLLKGLGANLVQWDAAEYGVPTLGLTYVSTEGLLAERPDDLRAFVQAAMQGILYAQEHPEEAIEIVLKYAPEADPAHMRFMLDTELVDLTSPETDAHGIGYSSPEKWQALAELLAQYQALPADLDVTPAFTNQFLAQK